MKNRYFIHIGFPKTASTYLQTKVFPNIKNINYANNAEYVNKWLGKLRSFDTSYFKDKFNLYEKLEKKTIQNGFIPITTKEISGQFELSEKKCLELLHVLKNQKKLVKVNIDLWMHSKNIDRLYLLNKNHFQSNNELDISSFKSYTGLTRKFAIPVLEFCDKQGWTLRMGNLRIKGENL